MSLPGMPVAWYGDDFTGATDVLEVLSLAGLNSALFLRVPDPALLARFPGLQAAGIAGDARSRPPEWMDANLPAVYGALGKLGPTLVHYKVCSTFDSSPRTGSIGRALDLGREAFGTAGPVPIIVGAPALRRYCAFGNLFAAVGDETFRLDRHPTMSRHPVTPMQEADLRRHLALQSSARVASCDVLTLSSDNYRSALRQMVAQNPDAILFDVVDQRSLSRCGELIWEELRGARFTVASSGLEYALTAYWKSAGLLPEHSAPPMPTSVDRIAVVSGSCAPATAAQIRHCESLGWESLAADPQRLAEVQTRGTELERLEAAATRALGRGASVVIHTACGPEDPRVSSFDSWLRGAEPMRRREANAAVGTALGTLLDGLVTRFELKRVVVAGGDTCGVASAALGIDALTLISPTSPGSPLCRAHSARASVDGISVVLKGGQVGGADFFESVRLGRTGSTTQRF